MPDDETETTIHFTKNLLPPLPGLASPLLKAGVKGKIQFLGMSQWPEDLLEDFLRKKVQKADGAFLTELEIYTVLKRFQGRLPA